MPKRARRSTASRRPSAAPGRDRRTRRFPRRTARTSWSPTRTASGSSASTPNFTTNTFIHNAAATLDLMTCTTPSGQPCEHPDLRPINWPICPIIDSSSRYGFVTLRGGGLFVVDAKATPMAIVGEYDKATVKGNGCGGVEVGGHMYLNSGGSPVNVSSADPHHPALYGFDVYRFPTRGLLDVECRQRAGPALLFSKGGMSDSHGIAPSHQGRYLWVMDRHANVAEIIEVPTGTRVNTVNLAGALSADPAPDLSTVRRREPPLRRAARPDAAERRSAQRDRQHAGPRDHSGDARRPRRQDDGGGADDQRAPATRPGARRARHPRAGAAMRSRRTETSGSRSGPRASGETTGQTSHPRRSWMS